MQFESRKQEPAKILIVEDELTVAEHTKNILESLNFEITDIASTGEKGVTAALTNPPDLILMDVKLKGPMDGIESANRILKKMHVPVIYVTAYTDTDILERARKTNPFGYLSKPFDIGDLHSAIEIALHKHKSEEWQRISKQFLEITSQNTDSPAILKSFIRLVRKSTGWKCAGIRLYTWKGMDLPFQHAAGFPKAWREACSRDTLSKVPFLDAMIRRKKEKTALRHSHLGTVMLPRGLKQPLKKIPAFDTKYIFPPGCRTAVIMPLKNGNRCLGVLHMANPSQEPMPDGAVEILESAVIQLAGSLERLRMQEDLKAHRRHLEEEVETRTLELKKTNRNLRREVREHRAARRALQGSRSSFHNIVERSEDGIMILDSRHTIRFANQTACHFLQKSPQTIVGHKFSYDLPEYNPRELPVRRKNGQSGIAEFRISETEWDGEKAWLWMIRDITERKKVEQLKTDFVSLVSHQLKTPAAEIRELCDTLLLGLADPLTEKQITFIDEMRSISIRNHRLISGLLDVSRIERGIVNVDIRAVLLKPVIRQIEEKFTGVIHDRGLSLTLDLPEEPVWIMADKDKLVEAVSNVVDNAVKFSEKGTITIRAWKNKRNARIEVEDEGIGIPREQQPKLFRKDQVLSGGPAANTGCGLGLYIAREFMKLQNGDIQADPQRIPGSRFVFHIPLAPGKTG